VKIMARPPSRSDNVHDSLRPASYMY
jgi:hypothetical protein